MALFPYGASFYHDNDSNGVYTEVSNVVSIDWPDKMAAAAQTTVLKSTGAVRTYIAGFLDADTFKVKLRWSSAIFVTLHALGRTSCPWRIVLPLDTAEASGAQLDFSGFISKLGAPQFSSEEDKVIDLDIEIKISGALTYTAAA